MAFTPPTTFVPQTVLTSADLEGNCEALRVYLHDGIIASDLENVKWVQTRHVQPPEYLPYQGLTHGVSGYQGGQWAGGVNIRLSFATKFLTGNGRNSNNSFINVQSTSFSLDIRREAKVLFHYWWEWEVGKDQSTPGYQVAVDDRLVWICPFLGSPAAAFGTFRSKAQETRNAGEGITGSYPYGADEPFTKTGGYDAKQGTLMVDYDDVGTLTFGLASHSQVDRVGIVNWGVAVEIYYL
jgi:hypothetical protein